MSPDLDAERAVSAAIDWLFRSSIGYLIPFEFPSDCPGFAFDLGVKSCVSKNPSLPGKGLSGADTLNSLPLGNSASSLSAFSSAGILSVGSSWIGARDLEAPEPWTIPCHTGIVGSF